MALNDLHSIKNVTDNTPIERLNGSRRRVVNRISSKAGNGFQNILAAFQTQNSDNVYKTRGLTIADYRARPVISKSRCRPQSAPADAELKNTATERFSRHMMPPAIKKNPVRNHSLCEQDLKDTDIVAKSDKTDKQQVTLSERQIIAKNVQKAAAQYNLPPELVTAVIRAESNFKVRAVSSAGARGLMQLMPATAKELGVENSFDIEQNIDGGAKYLRKMLDRFGGNVRKALAAYNAGPGTVIKYSGRVPYPETRQYVKRVLRFSKQMV
jgi:soluble lytic murein transglycosylase-like protein